MEICTHFGSKEIYYVIDRVLLRHFKKMVTTFTVSSQEMKRMTDYNLEILFIGKDTNKRLFTHMMERNLSGITN